jgi:hypothetical protein
LLSAKELVDGQQYFGLYLQQLQQRSKALHALTEPMIGDGLMSNDKEHTFWLQALAAKGGKLDPANLKQQAAVPLSSFLRYDPWTDQVIALHSTYEPLLMAADKMPFEIAPIYIKLAYYKAPAEPAPATAPPTEAPAAAGDAPAAATPPPAPADTTATPPAAQPQQ